MKVTIIDYGVGNLRSVQSAFRFVGAETVITDSPDEVEKADCLILPGVGAFGPAVKALTTSGLTEAMTHAVFSRGVPFLGICLGMQLLADKSMEFGEHQGLGWIPGKVLSLNDKNVRLPHIGFNSVGGIEKSSLLNHLPTAAEFYFVHSYHFIAEREQDVLAVTKYGDQFSSIINNGNIFGAQFHPEKSQSNGLQLLANFLKLGAKM